MASERERAAKLREAGLGYEDIARYLGVGKGTVYRWLNPKHAEQQRKASLAWKHRNRERVRDYSQTHAHKPCPHCGEPHYRGNNQCEGCRRATETVRMSLIEGMWADGWLLREIADGLGTTTGSICVSINRMRRAGWDLPRRYAMANGKRVAA